MEIAQVLHKARHNFSLANGLSKEHFVLEIAYSNNLVYTITYEKQQNKGAIQENICQLQMPLDNFAKKVFCELAEYFMGQRKNFSFGFVFEGTVFQKEVWQELLKIPYGKTCSYKDIAKNIGKPKAMRAVGNACNKNPLAIIVPCHRVVANNGKLQGYAGGLAIKNALLMLEKSVQEKSI